MKVPVIQKEQDTELPLYPSLRIYGNYLQQQGETDNVQNKRIYTSSMGGVRVWEGASMGGVRVWEGVSFGGCECGRGASVGGVQVREGCECGRVQVWEE